MATKPISSAPASGYGAKRARGVVHYAWDLPGVEDAPVVAPEDAIVTGIRYNGTGGSVKLPPPWDGYGPGIVLLRGASGVWHLLAHVAPSVMVGQTVREGQDVATLTRNVGASGPHVHWEVRTGRAIDSPQTRAKNTVSPQAWLDGRVRGGAVTAPSSGTADDAASAVWSKVKRNVRDAVVRERVGQLAVLLVLLLALRERRRP